MATAGGRPFFCDASKLLWQEVTLDHIEVLSERIFWPQKPGPK